jgi:hypothetical protein
MCACVWACLSSRFKPARVLYACKYARFFNSCLLASNQRLFCTCLYTYQSANTCILNYIHSWITLLILTCLYTYHSERMEIHAQIYIYIYSFWSLPVSMRTIMWTSCQLSLLLGVSMNFWLYSIVYMYSFWYSSVFVLTIVRTSW